MSAEAFSFRTPLNLAAIRALLVAEGSVVWRGGDNDFWGAYLVARLREGTRLRLFVDGDRFVVDITAATDEEHLSLAREFVHDKLLPCLGAHDVQPHDGWE